MIRVAIVGAGFIAHAHAAAYASLPDVDLVMIADPRRNEAERLAATYGARAETSAEAVWRSDVDVVSICTPTPTHAELSIAGLRAGKHMLCEKPIAGNVADAEAILEAAASAETTGTRFMVGHVSRFEADHLKAKAVLDSGDIGTLRMASQSITGPFPDWSSDGWFADSEKSGGPLVDLAIHSFDYLAWLFAKPVVRVSTVGVWSKIALPTYALSTLSFDGGGLATVEVSWAHPTSEGLRVRTEIAGTRGRISWNYADIAAMRVVQEGSVPKDVLMPGENSFKAQIRSFIDSIQNGTPVAVGAREALTALRIALAADESVRTGLPVPLGQVDTQGVTVSPTSSNQQEHCR